MFKSFKTVLTIALLGFAFCASAQNTKGSTQPYNRLSLSYDNTQLWANDKMEGIFMGEDNMYLNGFGLEYIHGFSVSKKLPMFVELGIKAQMGFGSVTDSEESDYDQTMKLQTLSFSVPVNYTYRIPLGDRMNLAPYVGLNFKLHAMGRMKSEVSYYDDDYDYDYDYGYGYEDEDEDEWANIFDKKDMGGKNYTWNRFQMGWQIGMGFNYKALYLGLQYGTDFISFYKYKSRAINTGNFAFKIGVNF